MSGHIINPEAVGDPNQTPRVQLFTPTPSRLELLAAVADGRVFRDFDRHHYAWVRGFDMRVDGRIRNMADAGWVVLGVETNADGTQIWELTDEGRDVLDGAS